MPELQAVQTVILHQVHEVAVPEHLLTVLRIQELPAVHLIHRHRAAAVLTPPAAGVPILPEALFAAALLTPEEVLPEVPVGDVDDKSQVGKTSRVFKMLL